MENISQNTPEIISQEELTKFIAIFEKWKNYSKILNEADHDLPPETRSVRGSNDAEYVEANRHILNFANELEKLISELGKEKLVTSLESVGRMDAVETVNLFTQTINVKPKKLTTRFEKFKKLFD